ncbi:MAG: ornithine cyclodeaminase family protein [Gammaproteobacteria bacterium]
MRYFSAGEVFALAPMRSVIDCLHEAFRGASFAPPRQAYPVSGVESGRVLLSMPAFHPDGTSVIKLVTVFPDNPARDLPAIQGVIVLFSATGTPVAMLDGAAVTRLRTAAASALASRYLSRQDSEHLVIVGTGPLAPRLAQAHCLTRRIRRISVWGRRVERAFATVEAIRELVGPGKFVHPTTALAQTVATADIVSCSTSSASPVLEGKWLRPGTFVDLVGSFSPHRREADDDVVRGSRIFVDTLEGALAEAGDLLLPLSRGVISRASIEAELAGLVRGDCAGRADPTERVVFKSVGSALMDLASARLVVEAHRQLHPAPAP